MQSLKEFREEVMPEGCRESIDLIHMDKGKMLTMGNFPSGKKGKTKDQACLLAKNADYPFDSFEIKIKENEMKNVDFFAVTHHGLPIRVHPWVAMPAILYALPAQKGMRFDIGLNASCNFIASDTPYAIQTPMRNDVLEKEKRVEENMDSEGRHAVIECKANPKRPARMTSDHLDRAEQVFGKKVSKVTRHGSILKEFIDAGKWRKDNNTRFIFHSDGELTFTPNYFTEQWFMIRSGGQMKKKTVFGKRESPSGLKSKWKRLNREINFLFDGGEWKTLVDVSGKDVETGQPGETSDKIIKGNNKVQDDPNTHVIHKAFIDPEMMKEISLKSPRHGKVKTATVKVKAGTTCEIRTNFKRRPSTMVENLLFCTKLDNEMNTFNGKARRFVDKFDEMYEDLKEKQKKGES